MANVKIGLLIQRVDLPREPKCTNTPVGGMVLLINGLIPYTPIDTDVTQVHQLNLLN